MSRAAQYSHILSDEAVVWNHTADIGKSRLIGASFRGAHFAITERPESASDRLPETSSRILVCSALLGRQAAAEVLHLSPDTVKTHLGATYRKLAVTGLSHAVNTSFETGLWRPIDGPDQPPETLTAAEAAALNQFRYGVTANEVGKQLNKSAETVRSTITRVYRRWQVPGLTSAVLLGHLSDQFTAQEIDDELLLAAPPVESAEAAFDGHA